MTDPYTITLDLRRIATIRAEKGWSAPLPENMDQKLLMVHEEISEANRTRRDGHTLPEIYYAAETGWWCKAHHSIACFECQYEGHPNRAQMIEDNWEHYEISKPEGFGVEVADAIMRLADIVFCNGIDLQRCLEEKMAFNAQRPFKHGGKKF